MISTSPAAITIFIPPRVAASVTRNVSPLYIRLRFSSISCNYFHSPSLTPYCTRWLNALSRGGDPARSFFFLLRDVVPRFNPRARDMRFFSFFSSCSFRISNGGGGRKADGKREMETFFFPRRESPSRHARTETKRNETPHALVHSLVSTAIFLSFVSINRALSSVAAAAAAAARGNPRLSSRCLSLPLFLLLHHVPQRPSPRRIYRWKPEAAIN